MEFNSLLCLNNMPIKRYADWLLRAGALSDYMALLVGAFNAEAVSGVMCHNTLSVSWDGRLFDCDFNQQLDLPLPAPRDAASAASACTTSDTADARTIGRSAPRPGLTVWDVASLGEVAGRPIAIGSHCYGCTAGSGSSCQGATAA